MKASIKKRWLEALNSGDYKQGRGNLRTDDNFCCLGVLCDLYDKKGWKILNDSEGDYYAYLSGSATATLPLKVMEWAGLKQDNPHIPDGKPNLATLNDSGKTFKQIARIIKKYL